MEHNDKVKAVCPACGSVFHPPRKAVKPGFDGVKCSQCFKERCTFVNLVLTRYEINKINAELNGQPYIGVLKWNIQNTN